MAGLIQATKSVDDRKLSISAWQKANKRQLTSLDGVWALYRGAARMADVRAQPRRTSRGESESPRSTGRFLGPDNRTGPPLMTVKLVESHGHALAIEGAEPTRYGLGPSGWSTFPCAKGVTLDLLRDWIEESYRIVAPKRLVAELDRR